MSYNSLTILIETGLSADFLVTGIIYGIMSAREPRGSLGDFWNLYTVFNRRKKNIKCV